MPTTNLPTTSGARGRVALIATGVLVVIFAIQLVGVVIGQLPVEGSSQSRLFFGVVMLAGLASSILAFVSLYRQVHRAGHGEASTEDPHR